MRNEIPNNFNLPPPENMSKESWKLFSIIKFLNTVNLEEIRRTSKQSKRSKRIPDPVKNFQVFERKGIELEMI